MGTARVAYALVRLCALNELQYRVNFFVYVFQSLLSLGTGLAVIWLVFDNVDELNGWSRPELLVVLGSYTVLGGVLRAIIQPNMLQLMAEIQDGTFDFVLVKPVDAQLVSSLRQMRAWQGIDVGAGFVVVAVGAAQLDTAVTVSRVASFLAMLGAGVLIVYCFWLLVTTVAFWALRMENVAYLFEGAYQAGRWPVGIYPGWMRISLTFLVPIAFAVTVPAEALTGRLSWATVALTAVVTIGFVVVSRRFFLLGIRRYGGASA